MPLTQTFITVLVAVVLLQIAAHVGATKNALPPGCSYFPCVVSAATSQPLTTLSVDPTACLVFAPNATHPARFNCPMCLSGDASYTALLQALGVGNANPRTVTPLLLFDNWLSSILESSIMSILLREALGFTALETTSELNYSEANILCCPDRTLLATEMWPTSSLERVTTPNMNLSRGDLLSGPLGTTGYSSLFVAGSLMQKMPLLTTYHSLALLPEYLSKFPAAFSTPCELLLTNASKGCVEGNYVCDTNSWKTARCDRGRYVPPQCTGIDPGSGLPRVSFCRELLLADPNWDPGYFEGLITNTGLNFTLAYLGSMRLPTYVRDQASKGIPQLFYWFSPDPFVVQMNAQPVQFTPSTPACVAKQSIEPDQNRGDCDYARASLRKSMRRRDAELEPDLGYLMESFRITDDDVHSMMLQHVASGGTMQAFDIACGWLKGNTDTWKQWVRNTPSSRYQQDASSAERLVFLQQVVGGVAGGVGGLLLVLLISCLVVNKCRAHRRNSSAPVETPFAIVFTDIQSSSALWEAYPEAMGRAVEMHHMFLRQAIEDFGAYEVKTNGDSFMIAVGNTADAIAMAVEIQNLLMDADWPVELIDPYDGLEASRLERAGAPRPLKRTVSKGNATLEVPTTTRYDPTEEGEDLDRLDIWRGLRVRIGVHHCEEASAKFDVVTGRYDYYGHDVNVSARIESAAAGGQILVSQSTLEALSSTAQYQLQLECVVRPYVHAFELKGISTPMTLYTVLPLSLQDRTFPPPLGYEDADPTESTTTPGPDIVTLFVTGSSSSDDGGGGTTGSSDHSGGGSGRFSYKTSKAYLEEILKALDRFQGDTLLQALLLDTPMYENTKHKSFAKKRQMAALMIAERLAERSKPMNSSRHPGGHVYRLDPSASREPSCANETSDHDSDDGKN